MSERDWPKAEVGGELDQEKQALAELSAAEDEKQRVLVEISSILRRASSPEEGERAALEQCAEKMERAIARSRAALDRLIAKSKK